MKFFRTLLLTACFMLLAPLGVCAQENIMVEETENSVWTANFETGVLEITGSGELTANGLSRQFMQMLTDNTFKKLVICEGFSSIYKSTFARYPFKFTEIVLPSTMSEIGQDAFASCDSIENIVLPEGVSIVGAGAFDCEKLTTITVPSTVTKIYTYAFGRSIKAVYISDLAAWCNIEFGIESYGNPMANWENFTAGVTTFSEPCDLYLNGEKIVDLVIPVPAVKRNAFFGCSAESVTFAPDCLENDSVICFIARNAFAGMSNLKKIVIPDGAVVQACSFEGCSSLEELVIGDNVSFAEEYNGKEELVYTFAGCDNLKRLVIGEGIEVLEDIFGHKYSSNGLNSNYAGEKGSLWLESIVIPGTLKEIRSNINFIKSWRDEDGNWVEKSTQIYFKDELSWWNSIYGLTDYDCYVAGKKWEKPLGDVVVPNGVERISYGKLNHEGVTSVTLPEGIMEIRDRAFYGAKNLHKVNIPQSVTVVGEKAFGETDWYNVQPDGLLYLDNWLVGCKGDYTNNLLDIKAGTTGIARGAFFSNASIENVILPVSIKNICADAFAGCSNLCYLGTEPQTAATSGVIDLSSNACEIAEGVFEACSSIEEVRLGASIKKIGDKAFFIQSIKKIIAYSETPAEIENDTWSAETRQRAMVYVPKGAVYNYKSSNYPWNFTYLMEIGNPVIGEYNNDCHISLNVETGLLAVNGYGGLHESSLISTSSWLVNDIKIGDSVCIQNNKIFDETAWYNAQPDGMLYADGWLLGYKGENIDDIMNIEVKNGTRGIAGCAFLSNKKVSEVNIPESIKFIGEKAFYQCTSLKNIDINGKNTIISNQAFEASSIETASLNGVSSIGDRAFYACDSLRNVDVSGNNAIIGNSAFESSSVETISLKGISSIEKMAFKRCRNLTSIEIPNSVHTLGESAFQTCSKLKAIEIPHSVQTLGERVFEGCSNVGDVVIGDGVKEIPIEAFSELDSLKNIIFGRNVEIINQKAFACRAVREINIYLNATTPPAFVAESERLMVFFSTNYKRESSARAAITVYVPKGSKAAYDEAWTDFRAIVELAALAVDEVADNAPEVNAIYNLRGDKLQQITSPGIYIVNGRKVLIR